MNFRNIPHLLLAIAFSLTCAVSAQDEATKPKENDSFSNLPKAQRDAFIEHVGKASRLFAEKRIFEVLDELAKADAIFPDSVDLLNLKGSCYVEFRDFARARALYKKALTLAPESTTVRFNLAEIDFCTKDWQRCNDSFTQLLEQLDAESQTAMRHLVEFKILLCKLKLGKIEEARKLTDKHDFLDDSPYHFFAKSALAFHDDDKVAAEQWLARAVRIFRRPEVLAPWQDTLIEFGYIKSFYGGDLEE